MLTGLAIIVAMTSVLCLRVWRPSIHAATRAPAALILGSRRSQRLFHAGPLSGTNALRREQDGSSGPVTSDSVEAPQGRRAGEGTSQFKQMRQRIFADEAAKELYPETHPRLKPGEARRPSISEFKEMAPLQPSDSPVDMTTMSTLYGRIKSIRQMGGKLVFVTLVNEVDTIQAMINQRKLEPLVNKNQFKLFQKMIEIGDHVSITGEPVRSSTGDLVIEARTLPELVSPTMEQIPRSLTDPETKAQKRHLDMLVNPEVSDTIRLRSHIMQYIRDHFLRDDFLEVQTPILAHNAGGAVARPFTTRATELPHKELSLRVAPELWLKRLVVGGLNRVFEMGPSFRNEGVDATHNPEFTTCEFYSAYTNLDDLMGITESLLGGLAARCDELIDGKLKSLSRVDPGKFHGPYERVEFVPSLQRAMGFRLPNLTSEHALSEVLAMLKLAGVPVPGESVPATLPKLLDRLAAEYLEPKSLQGKPIFITNHPACMSPLAKSFMCPSSGQLVSARAELFVDGREIANMYEEENDPAAQARKLREYRAMSYGGRTIRDEEITEEEEQEEYEGENEKQAVGEGSGERGRGQTREALAEDGPDLEPAPLDRHYIGALEAGLPPTGGWGCGVERLVMLFAGANRISDCLAFGTLRNVVGLTADGPEGAKGRSQGKPDGEKETGKGK